MSFMDLAKNRYSCRAFTDKAVEPEKLAQVLEAGRLSPTAINAQRGPDGLLRRAQMLHCRKI